MAVKRKTSAKVAKLAKPRRMNKPLNPAIVGELLKGVTIKTWGPKKKYDRAFFDSLADSLYTWADKSWKAFKDNADKVLEERRSTRLLLNEFFLDQQISWKRVLEFIDDEGIYKADNAKFIEVFQWAVSAHELWLQLDSDLNGAVRRVLLNKVDFLAGIDAQKNQDDGTSVTITDANGRKVTLTVDPIAKLLNDEGE